MEKKNQNERATAVIVIKEGVPKRLLDLPNGIIKLLEAAYDIEHVKSFSKESFMSLSEELAFNVVEYQKILEEGKENNIYVRAFAFAKACDITIEGTPNLFQLIFWVDQFIYEEYSLDELNLRWVKSTLRQSKSTLYHEFRKWKNEIEPGVGPVKFAKFFYLVATCL